MQFALPFVATPVSTDMYFVRHRWARRYLLRVEANGRVRVTIPRGGSKAEAARFAERQHAWIAAQRARLSTRVPGIAAEDMDRLRAQAAKELPVRLHELAARHGLEVARVSVRNQRARWGACGRGGHITLNWRLVAMPAWVRDYVIVHELMHLRELNHSKAYWAHVAAAYPDYQSARRWLRQHGATLL